MDYSSHPATTRLICPQLSRVGSEGSVRAVSHWRMRNYHSRLTTFLCWKPGMYGSPSPHALATAGFIYRGVQDQTQCFTCSLVLSRWLPVHNPDIEHHRHSPECEFLLSRSQDFDSSLLSSPITTPTSPFVKTEVPTEPAIVSTASPAEASLCKICYNQHMEILFRPCGHLLTCRSCANQLINCPICRSPITETIRAFVSFE